MLIYAKLRQVVQQQTELMQKQAEETRRREEELTCRQNELFKSFMQRYPAPQVENRVGPTGKQVGLQVRVQPPQPYQEPRAIALGMKPTSESL